MKEEKYKESKEALKSIKKSDWILVLVGFLLGFGTIIDGIFWCFHKQFNGILLIIIGLAVFFVVLFHLAWATKPKKEK